MMDQFLNDTQKKQLYTAVFAVVVILAVFLGIKSINALKEYSYIGRGSYAANVVTVTGKGEVMAIPDIASFSFSVVELGKTVGDAQDKASKKMNDAIDAIKALGVAEKDIQTTGYNSYPKYEYNQGICTDRMCPPSKQVLTGYEVSQTITVKVRKTADAGGILTKVGGLGVSNISGLNFVVDDIEAVQAEARDKAIADAKDKADKLEKSLGVKFVRIINFYEGGNYGVMGMGGDMMSAKAVSFESAQVAPQLPVGENKVTSQVSITYEIQ